MQKVAGSNRQPTEDSNGKQGPSGGQRAADNKQEAVRKRQQATGNEQSMSSPDGGEGKGYKWKARSR